MNGTRWSVSAREFQEQGRTVMRMLSKLRRLTTRSSALVIGVAASAPSTTGRLMGGFTLPVAAKWNHRTLPAGAYRFVVSPAISRSWVYVRGDDEAAVFYAASIEWATGAPGGLLCLVYDDSGYRVRSLKLRDRKEILYFDSRRPVPAPHDAAGWPGVLYVPLSPVGTGPGGIVPARHS
jgi:hypothetical protein